MTKITSDIIKARDLSKMEYEWDGGKNYTTSFFRYRSISFYRYFNQCICIETVEKISSLP